MRRRKTGDKDVDDNFVALDDDISIIKKIQILGGVLITGVALAVAADTDIRHHLGRIPVGWIVVDSINATATGRIQRIEGTHDRSEFLRIRATGFGATITVSIWVF